MTGQDLIGTPVRSPHCPHDRVYVLPLLTILTNKGAHTIAIGSLFTVQHASFALYSAHLRYFHTYIIVPSPAVDFMALHDPVPNLCWAIIDP